MRNKLLICLHFGLLTLTVSATAQSAGDTSTWKAIYFDFDQNIVPRGISVGATLLAHKNWFVASRLDWVNLDAPQLPNDFKVPKATYSGSSTDNGSCLICFDYSNISLGGGGQHQPDTEKHIRLFTFSAGWIYQLPNPKFRLRAEAGVARMKVKEPVDFVYVPSSVEEIGENIIRTTTEGYTFTLDERKMTGLLIRAGVEIPLTKAIGFNTSFSTAIAKDERMFGWNVGLLFGVLR